MRDTFLYETFGQELVAPLKSARVPGRYVIPSGQLCREYNRWRAESGLRDQVSNKRFTMVSHGTGYGIGRDTSIKQYNAFNIDSDTLRAALTRDFWRRRMSSLSFPIRVCFIWHYVASQKRMCPSYARRAAR